MWSTDLKHNSSWCSSVSDCWTPLAPDPGSLSPDSDHTLLKNVAMLVHPARNGRAGRNKLNRFPARKTAPHARVIRHPLRFQGKRVNNATPTGRVLRQISPAKLSDSTIA